MNMDHMSHGSPRSGRIVSVETPDVPQLPWRVDDGVKEFHLSCYGCLPPHRSVSSSASPVVIRCSRNLALRLQLMVCKRRIPPKIGDFDTLFWTAFRRKWSKWEKALVIVSPETVVRWHRSGFRLYWHWISRHRKTLGRRQLSKSCVNSSFATGVIRR